MSSPFTYGSLVSHNGFLNRERDKALLSSNIESGVNTILISPRRWGKSSLVQEVSHSYSDNKDYVFVFLDLFMVKSEAEFFQQFSVNVLKAGSSKVEVWMERARKFLGKLVPFFSLSLDPQSEVSLKFDMKDDLDPSEILDLPEKLSKDSGKTFVICLDEFQNIEAFSNPLAFQKLLRAYWQKHEKAVYVLYGSKQHMMQELFSKPSYPFYKFGDLHFLEKIEKEEWGRFFTEKVPCKKKVHS